MILFLNNFFRYNYIIIKFVDIIQDKVQICKFVYHFLWFCFNFRHVNLRNFKFRLSDSLLFCIYNHNN